MTNLIFLGLPGNLIVDISPLSGLTNLDDLSLLDNGIIDIKPLVDNTGINRNDTILLVGNPLNDISINTYIPELRARGVDVDWP